jgi:hypothetical protein
VIGIVQIKLVWLDSRIRRRCLPDTDYRARSPAGVRTAAREERDDFVNATSSASGPLTGASLWMLAVKNASCRCPEAASQSDLVLSLSSRCADSYVQIEVRCAQFRWTQLLPHPFLGEDMCPGCPRLRELYKSCRVDQVLVHLAASQMCRKACQA